MKNLYLALSLLLLADCACRKTDAQRAKEEREAVDRRLRSSLTLFPYRLVKLSARSRNSPNRPAAVDAVGKVLDETRALPQEAKTPAEVAKVAATYGELLVALIAARESMKDRDEDEFPPLFGLTALALFQLSTYGSEEEHLMLATLFFLLDEADSGDKLPGETEIVLYELSRATPQPEWSPELTLMAQLLRGGSYHAAGAHYAAEEELTSSIALLEASVPEPGHLVTLKDELLVAAHFIRALNRQKLGRDDGVTEDLESILISLRRMGVDNELTWWAEAAVSSRRGNFEASAKALERLASSEYLDATGQAAMREAAASMRATATGIPVLLQARATAILLQALLARAGGVEAVLKSVFGDETAKEILGPVNWLDRTRKQLVLSRPTLPNLGDLKPIEYLKSKLPGQRQVPAGQSSSDAN